MKWVLWLALVGLVSKADSRSINYEYENEQGLDSEQKGVAGQVKGKYETMDHNGEVVEVKYIADHMGFRLIDELEVTDKDINSPNAEPEIEPTESMTQTAEQTTDEPIDSSVKLTEQEIEPTTRTTLEAEENEDEEEEDSSEENEAKETEKSEAEETGKAESKNEEETTEASITEEEIKSESITPEEETNPIESEIESETEVTPTEEEKESTTEDELMNVEEVETNNIVISERKGEDSENNEEPSESKSLNQDEPVINTKEQESFTAEVSVSKSLDSTVKSVIPVAMKLEVISEKDNKQVELVSKKSGMVSDSKSTIIEITTDPIDNAIGAPILTSSMPSNMVIKQEVIAERIEPRAQINSVISDTNAFEIEQETLQPSSSAKSLLSVQNVDNTLINDDLHYKLTEILQVPTSYISFQPLPSLPQPLQVVDVIDSNSNGLEIEQEFLAKSLNSNPGLSNQAITDEPFVYYDNQSPDGSKIIIKEIDHEINVTPKRMVTLSSKQLNNVNPGTVMIEKTSISETQSEPEVVIVRKGDSGVLTIEAQLIEKEIAVEPLNRRSSMKIESELVDRKDFILGEESNIIVREILPSEGTVQSQLVEEAQINIETNEVEPLVVLPDSPEVLKITVELPPITIEKSLAESMPKMPVEQEMVIETEVIEDIPLPMALKQPEVSKTHVLKKVSVELPAITIEKSLAESMPKMPVEQEMVIETEVIEDIPLPMALTQPEVSKTHVLKKVTESKAPKQFVRSITKPIPVLLQQISIPNHSFEKAPVPIQRISQQPTPKEVRIVEVRGAPKQTRVVQVNPDAQVKILESDQVIHNNKNTKITTEVIDADEFSSEIKSFKVRDFVRF